MSLHTVTFEITVDVTQCAGALSQFRAVALVDCQVGYAENAFDWYPGDPRRNAVGTAVAWRIQDGVTEVRVRWLVGITSWVAVDKLAAIEAAAR